MQEIRYKNLSWVLKLVVVYSIISILVDIGVFLIAIMLGFLGALI